MHTNHGLKIINEGKSKFYAYLVPDNAAIKHVDLNLRVAQNKVEKWKLKLVPTKSMPVFYNPHMDLNRDLSVLAFKVISGNKRDGMKIGDMMCGIGIRGIRYLSEAGRDDIFVDFLDLNPLAIKLCKKNLKLNKIKEKRYKLHVGDVNGFLFSLISRETERYSLLDIDPFGNPMFYVQSAIKALKHDNSYLQVNATDLAVLSGVHEKASRRKYHVHPMRNVSYHAEMAVRVLIGAIFRRAIEQDCTVIPKFSIARRHYIKTILEKSSGARKAMRDLKNLGFIIQCRNCKNHYSIHVDEIQGESCCMHCESRKIDYCGPLWIGDIHNKSFCDLLLDELKDLSYLKNRDRLFNIISRCSAESEMPIGSHDLHEISKDLKISPPSLDHIIAELRNSGFHASRTHYNPTSIKTNALREDLARIIEKTGK
ncbi:MAG: hypothetical protein ACTSWN_08375 [Promethearchaeota archaeon]